MVVVRLLRSALVISSLVISCCPRLALAGPLALNSGGTGDNTIYRWSVPVPGDRPVSNLRITDIYLPNQIRIEWDYTPLSNPPQVLYEVQRGISGVWTTLGTTPLPNQKYWVDTYSYTSGSQIQYRVRVAGDTGNSMGLPPPPPCADPAEIWYYPVASGYPWIAITMTPVISAATENQAVDSRYDLRYSTYVFKDFQFGTKTYRGGLYAGFANDPSRVGRSFVKFQLSALPSGQDLWTGSVNAWYTQSAATGNTTVGCQKVTSTWDATTIKWTTAPTIQNAVDQITLNYDGTTGSSKWGHWNMAGDISAALFGNGLVSFALFSTSETTNAWAYFGKKEWQNAPNGSYRAAMPRPPQIVYCYGGLLWAIDLYVEPNSILKNSTATGSVFLSAPAPMGGAQVTLSSSNPSVASVPASVTIPAGQVSANFTVTTGFVYQNTTVAITGTYGGLSQTATITVRPN